MAERRAAARRKSDSSERPDKTEQSHWKSSWLDESAAVLCFAIAVFLLSSFFSLVAEQGWTLSPRHGRPDFNLMGPVGLKCALMLAGWLGWCALVPVACLIWLSVVLWRLDEKRGPLGISWRSIVGSIGVLVFSATIAAALGSEAMGGQLGSRIAYPLIRLFDRVGASLFAIAGMLLSLSLVTGASALDIAKGVGLSLLWMALVAVQIPWLGIKLTWRALAKSFGWLSAQSVARKGPLPPPRLRKNKLPEPLEKIEESKSAATEQEAEPEVAEDPDEEVDEITHVVVSRKTGAAGKRRQPKAPEEKTAANGFPPYRIPSRELLQPGEVSAASEDDKELVEKSRLIENKLKDFGVFGRVTQVHPGPVITLFEFEPAPGVKVGRVAALSDDLAMSLRAQSIRVIAPIPKRGTVGIEIPNRHRDIVRLRDLLESESFVSGRSVLNVCLGKDTYGEPVVVDITSMPHLLVAGATGTGKSVLINTLLLSLLYRASPAEVGLILIDPKILELSVYEGIPHLRVPVVTNPRQAKAVLQWAVDEMHRRYRLIQRFEVRSIDGYNRIVRGETEPEKKTKTRLQDNVVLLSDDSVVAEGKLERETPVQEPLIAEKLEPLPKIVIVIDEVADLMLSVGRDIEELITRLAQKARAAGIHLIIATQRPSVDVITGLIKANFPTRLSFRVTSRVDSRTILDSMGAEKLLGDGDMLVLQPGGAALKRVHGAYVSDSEVKKVINDVKAQSAPHYDERIMRICERALEEEAQASEGSAEALGEDRYDPVYDKAVEFVVQKGQASTSMIQRVFNIGYNRAARIIETMEKEGIVGPMNGSNRREVLLAKAEQSEG